MKKLLLLFSLCSLLFSLSEVRAYTSTDVSNASFLAEKGLIVTQSTAAGYRLDDTITRAEVVGIALKIKWIVLPEDYQCKKYFLDTLKNDWVCRAVELAADNGIITRSNKYANPGKLVTRAEALAMLMNAGGFDTNLSEAQLISMESFRMKFDTSITWHQDILLRALFYKIIDTKKYVADTGKSWPEWVTWNSTALEVKFYPNRLATRAEVFGFGKQLFSTREIINNETEIQTKDWVKSLFSRLYTESPPPMQEFKSSNELSQKFLQQDFLWNNYFKNDDNFLALTFFVLNESPLYDELHYFYYGWNATTKSKLRILRNTVYARHGRSFDSEDLQIYFGGQTWYKKNINYTDSMLSSIDMKNIDFIKKNEDFLKQ